MVFEPTDQMIQAVLDASRPHKLTERTIQAVLAAVRRCQEGRATIDAALGSLLAGSAGHAADTLKSLLQGKPGKLGDGNKLYLQVREGGHLSWLLRYSSPTHLSRTGSPAREAGLGPYPDVSLAQARRKAARARVLIANGIDPIEAEKTKNADRKAAAAAAQWTFAAAVDDYIKTKVGKQAKHGKNAKHQDQWRATLNMAVAQCGKKRVSAVTREDVLTLLDPIWTTKTETATRLRGRVETVLSYATFKGWRTGENPARWRGNLEHVLPSPGKVAKKGHHAALPWRKLPDFMPALRDETGVPARALEFTILTAARTGETIGATWAEIDMDEAVWTIPAHRMKMGKEHRVPLTPAALSVLRGMVPLRDADADGSDYVFPGQRTGKSLSGMAMLMLLRRMKRGDLTTHGFRSAFKDWAGETTAHPREVIEHALAHQLKDPTEAAYQRGDLFMKRRVLMADWAAFCAKAPADVVTLAERRA